VLPLYLSVVTYIAICCRFTKKLKFGKGLFFMLNLMEMLSTLISTIRRGL